MKRIVILTNGGGELANQLWNYLSIYAYGLYTGSRVSNPSFFEYHRHFRFLKNETLTARFFSYWFQGAVRRRGHPVNKFWRRVYRVYSGATRVTHPSSCVSSQNQESRVTYLPPTAPEELPARDTSYFLGWLFRNPDGLQQFRAELHEAFRPAPSIENRVSKIVSELPKTKVRIGVHIRQSDYAIFKNGSYIVPPSRMREVIDEYLRENSLAKEDCSLLITSDGKVDPAVFAGYETYISAEDAVTDLFLLSHTNVIIGSNSSFGHFASWFGNIPHIVAENDSMDWEYYSDKKEYFPNKYATLARLS